MGQVKSQVISVIEMYDQGWSVSDIASWVGLSTTEVEYVLETYAEQYSVVPEGNAQGSSCVLLMM